MLGYLRGQILENGIQSGDGKLIVGVGSDTHGFVGYSVNVPKHPNYELLPNGKSVEFFVYTHVREDALSLYGFLSSREKHFFEMLLSASGVGPSLALKILSGMSVEELVPAIRNSDLARLTKIPGVGRKTAERMVVELRDKLDAVTVEVERPAASTPAGIEADVASALVNLGYDPRAAETAVAEAKREAGPSVNFEKLLRAALQNLSTPKGRAARP